VLQKNTSGYPIILPTLDPPVTVPAGEDIDHDTALAGFTPVDQLDAEPDPDPEQGSAKPPTSRNPKTDQLDAARAKEA
jgi:hypothetical protein